MHDKKYEKVKAKEILELIKEYENAKDKSQINKKLNELSDELYYKKREILSQAMVDVALAVHSFTTAAMSGGHYQPLDEFIPDLEEIMRG